MLRPDAIEKSKPAWVVDLARANDWLDRRLAECPLSVAALIHPAGLFLIARGGQLEIGVLHFNPLGRCPRASVNPAPEESDRPPGRTGGGYPEEEWLLFGASNYADPCMRSR